MKSVKNTTNTLFSVRLFYLKTKPKNINYFIYSSIHKAFLYESFITINYLQQFFF